MIWEKDSDAVIPAILIIRKIREIFQQKNPVVTEFYARKIAISRKIILFYDFPSNRVSLFSRLSHRKSRVISLLTLL